MIILWKSILRDYKKEWGKLAIGLKTTKQIVKIRQILICRKKYKKKLQYRKMLNYK